MKLSTRACLVAALFTAMAGLIGCNKPAGQANPPAGDQTQTLTEGTTGQSAVPAAPGAAGQK